MQKKRLDELEGLRGIAAVMVAVHHFLLVFYVVMFLGPMPGRAQNAGFEDSLYGHPLAVFISGTFAVAIFFVLSGFVLSIGFFKTKKLEIVKKLAARRYLRLMLPALASVLLCFVILSLGISKIHDVAAITHADWLVNTWAFQPDFFTAARSGAYDIFTYAGNPYNSVLWTMMYEFAGSFLVFGFLALFGTVKHRWILYVVLGVATFDSWFFAFIIGMAMADAFAQGRILTKRRSYWAIVPLVVGALFFGGYPYASVDGTIYQYITIADTINWNILYLTLGAAGIVLSILMSEQFARVMRNKYLSRLGKYTFSVYLVHLAVFYTFGMAVFLLFRNTLDIGFNMSVALTFLASIPVVAGVTYLFERFVDAPSIRFSSYVANMLLGKIVIRHGRNVYERLMKPLRSKKVS